MYIYVYIYIFIYVYIYIYIYIYMYIYIYIQAPPARRQHSLISQNVLINQFQKVRSPTESCTIAD